MQTASEPENDPCSILCCVWSLVPENVCAEPPLSSLDETAFWSTRVWSHALALSEVVLGCQLHSAAILLPSVVTSCHLKCHLASELWLQRGSFPVQIGTARRHRIPVSEFQVVQLDAALDRSEKCITHAKVRISKHTVLTI